MNNPTDICANCGHQRMLHDNNDGPCLTYFSTGTTQNRVDTNCPCQHFTPSQIQGEPPMKSSEQSMEQEEKKVLEAIKVIYCDKCGHSIGHHHEIGGIKGCENTGCKCDGFFKEPQTTESNGESNPLLLDYDNLHGMLVASSQREQHLLAQIAELKSALTQARLQISLHRHLYEGDKSTMEMIDKLVPKE